MGNAYELDSQDGLGFLQGARPEDDRWCTSLQDYLVYKRPDGAYTTQHRLQDAPVKLADLEHSFSDARLRLGPANPSLQSEWTGSRSAMPNEGSRYWFHLSQVVQNCGYSQPPAPKPWTYIFHQNVDSVDRFFHCHGQRLGIEAQRALRSGRRAEAQPALEVDGEAAWRLTVGVSVGPYRHA